MNELIEKVIAWGIEKGITGPNGKGTILAQVLKMMEEAKETFDAVYIEQNLDEVRDGIGDTMVTLILLAEMHGWTAEECLQTAYDVISKRKGQMICGIFVKQSDIDDDFNEPLGRACQLGDTECESCS